MQSMTITERRRLSSAVESLSQRFSADERPLGLKQRARSAFLKQLHAYKCAQLEALGGRRSALEDTQARRAGLI